MDELRALRSREAGDEALPGGVADPRPLPTGRPSREERRRRRELQRQGRHWWSLRGLGPGGWIGRIAILLLLGIVAWAGFGWLAVDGAVDEANGKITDSA